MKLFTIQSLFVFVIALYSCSSSKASNIKNQEKMELTNQEKAVAIIEAFETGNSKVLDYVSDEKYIQHNLGFPDGKKAIVGFFPDKPSGIKIQIHRVIEDGNFVALHSTYSGVWNNGTPQVVFDVFRFENGLMVEHWDNLLDVAPPNASGHTQTDGPTKIKDKAKTKANKEIVSRLMNGAFIEGNSSLIPELISKKQYIQHNPGASDGLEGLDQFVKYLAKNNIAMVYSKIYKVIADGDFVLTMADGTYGGKETAYYDLFRVEDGLIVEHWDVVTTIPPKSEWKNDNGKF